MFYEEKVIDGKLMCRSVPHGEWREVSNEVLTKRLKELHYGLDIAHSRLLTFDVMSEKREHGNIPSQQDILPKIDALLVNNRVTG